MYRILLVEDDMITARTIENELTSWGYEAYIADDFKRITDITREKEPHLILLDISLPMYNGFYWCREIRKESNVPIIFVSSAGENMNILTAIHQGADDFVCKPFDMAVLIAKIQSLLRRSYDFSLVSQQTIAVGDVILDTSALVLFYKDNVLELTRNEFKILQCLMERKGRVVSRDDVMEVLWQNDDFVDDNTLTVNMSRLRRRLLDIGLADFIETKKGLGYMVQGRV